MHETVTCLFLLFLHKLWVTASGCPGMLELRSFTTAMLLNVRTHRFFSSATLDSRKSEISLLRAHLNLLTAGRLRAIRS
ncbi:hypothetical protein KC19_2G210100 [Ceratodon purpureus]|uniref:Secreted protein n=1 Tax=Ceratodon purpureus TaxID=3225 RepID=A0A8T0IZE9_CERPU|nr:hypothetical protein KC19_2G210100 [Ceratodon purpureus]